MQLSCRVRGAGSRELGEPPVRGGRVRFQLGDPSVLLRSLRRGPGTEATGGRRGTPPGGRVWLWGHRCRNALWRAGGGAWCLGSISRPSGILPARPRGGVSLYSQGAAHRKQAAEVRSRLQVTCRRPGCPSCHRTSACTCFGGSPAPGRHFLCKSVCQKQRLPPPFSPGLLEVCVLLIGSFISLCFVIRLLLL